MVEPVLQKRELEIFRNTIHRPRNRVRLIAAHHQASDIFLVIDQPVRVAQCRQIARRTTRLRDNILMLDRLDRHGNPRHPPQFFRPLPRTDHKLLARNHMPANFDAGNPPVLETQSGNLDLLDDFHAAHPRTLGERQRDIRRVRLPVSRQKCRAHNVAHIHQRPEILRFLRIQQMHFKPEGMRRRRLPLDLGHALVIARQTQPAIHLPSRRLPRLVLERAIEFNRIFQELRHTRRRPQLPDKTRRMKARPRRQLVPLQQQHILRPMLGQMIRRRAPDNPATDDNNFRMRWQSRHRSNSLISRN